MDLDEDSAHARVVHYHYLFRRYMVHRGLIDDKFGDKSAEERGMRRLSYQEIQDRYPLRKTSDETD